MLKKVIKFRIIRDQLELLHSLGVGRESGHESLTHFPSVELGPDPAEMTVTENELSSENTMELNKLRNLLSKAKAEAELAKAELKKQGGSV